MKKINKTKNGTTSTLDFYDQLSEKQRTKFDNEKESFTIDFSEIESIYNQLNDRQTRTLLLAVGMFAAAGRTKDIDPEVMADLSGDPLTLSFFNSMALRIKNHTKSWLNGRGQKKEKVTIKAENDAPTSEPDTAEETETFEGADWEIIKRMALVIGVDEEWYEMDIKYGIAQDSKKYGKTPLEVAPDVLSEWKEEYVG